MDRRQRGDEETTVGHERDGHKVQTKQVSLQRYEIRYKTDKIHIRMYNTPL